MIEIIVILITQPTKLPFDRASTKLRIVIATFDQLRNNYPAIIPNNTSAPEGPISASLKIPISNFPLAAPIGNNQCVTFEQSDGNVHK